MDPAQEDLQAIWNEEASKLSAGAEPAQAAAPESQEDAVLDEASLQDAEPSEQQAAAQDEPQVDQTPAEDPYAGLPAAVVAKLAELDQLKQAQAQLLHEVKSQTGRVAAMQRELQASRQAQQTVAPQDAPTQGQIATAAKSSEKWEQLKADFPEWGSAMEEYVATQLSTVRGQSGAVDPSQVDQLVSQRVAEIEARTERRLAEATIGLAHKGWKQTVNTPEFTQWFAIQAPEVRALADSANPEDAIAMLDRFESTRAKPASEIRQQRNARLSAAATTRPGNTPPAKTLDDMSPEELWNFEAAQREKTRHQRGF